jgi:hypothetical protein
VPAYKSLDDETFSVRFLAHETQHFADKHNFGHPESWELEYRAKLTELALAVSSQDSTLQRICENRSPVNDSAHAYADFHVIRDMGQRLRTSDNGLCGPAGIRGHVIRNAARAILVSDSNTRKRSRHRKNDWQESWTTKAAEGRNQGPHPTCALHRRRPENNDGSDES